MLVLISVCFTNCNTKKKTFEFQSEKKFDSISYRSEKVVFPGLKDTVYLASPCDSLGNLKPFRETFTTAQGKVTVENKNGAIRTEIDLKEITNTSIEKDKVSIENTESKKEELKQVVRSDFKLWLALIISILFNLALLYALIRK